MLRIGKNPKDSADNEVSPEKQDASAYTSPRTYSSYQPAAPEVKAPAEYAPASGSPKAMTESETLAREIKEGNLSGFVGSGSLFVGGRTQNRIRSPDPRRIL